MKYIKDTDLHKVILKLINARDHDLYKLERYMKSLKQESDRGVELMMYEARGSVEAMTMAIGELEILNHGAECK